MYHTQSSSPTGPYFPPEHVNTYQHTAPRIRKYKTEFDSTYPSADTSLAVPQPQSEPWIDRQWTNAPQSTNQIKWYRRRSMHTSPILSLSFDEQTATSTKSNRSLVRRRSSTISSVKSSIFSHGSRGRSSVNSETEVERGFEKHFFEHLEMDLQNKKPCNKAQAIPEEGEEREEDLKGITFEHPNFNNWKFERTYSDTEKVLNKIPSRGTKRYEFPGLCVDDSETDEDSNTSSPPPKHNVSSFVPSEGPQLECHQSFNKELPDRMQDDGEDDSYQFYYLPHSMNDTSRNKASVSRMMEKHRLKEVERNQRAAKDLSNSRKRIKEGEKWQKKHRRECEKTSWGLLTDGKIWGFDKAPKVKI